MQVLIECTGQWQLLIDLLMCLGVSCHRRQPGVATKCWVGRQFVT